MRAKNVKAALANTNLGAYNMEASFPAKRVENRIRSKACAH